MLIILSPAKTMNMSPSEQAPNGTTPQFDTDAEFLAAKMRGYSQEELAKLLKISPALARINRERYEHFNDPTTTRKAAIYAYDGSVFKAISPSDFTVHDIEYAQQRVRIISTLYGLTRPLDMIKAYRIAFNLRLEGFHGNLYDYWHNKLTLPLIEATRNVGGVVVNLASLDVQAALNMEQLRDSVKVITPEFKQFRNGTYEVIRTYAKIARGAMTRFIIKERAETPQSLTKFEWNGYKFNESLSDADNYIYTRE